MHRVLFNKKHVVDPVWHAQIAVLVAIGLQFILPDKFVVVSRYGLTAVSLILLLALSFTTPRKEIFSSLGRRINVIFLAAVIGLTNVYSLTRVVNALLQGGVSNGRELILTAINIYLTNIIVFGLLYWEMDGGGPGLRKRVTIEERDFLFPQDNLSEERQEGWRPTFMDYLYVSSTNATAFSPTDTLPLSRRAKFLMLSQSFVSLITIALIAGRAVNILK